MEKLKKTVLMISGPGVILFEGVALFIHLFTTNNTKPWIVGGLIVFFVVFVPLYSFEYFRQEFKNDKEKTLHFKRNNKRTEWKDGNVHGQIPTKKDRPGKLFK